MSNKGIAVVVVAVIASVCAGIWIRRLYLAEKNLNTDTSKLLFIGLDFASGEDWTEFHYTDACWSVMSVEFKEALDEFKRLDPNAIEGTCTRVPKEQLALPSDNNEE
jgi:hypothetical protein